MSLAGTGGRGDAEPVARAEALLARAELDLLDGRIGAAEAILEELATILSGSEELPGLLGRTLWLVALLSLVQGSLEDFDRHSAAAIASLDLAGDHDGVAVAVEVRAEILDRLAAELAVDELGADGIQEVLDRYARRAVDRARRGGAWASVDRDRAHLAELLAVLDRRGQPAPLTSLLRGLGLDAVDAVILSLLIPLSSSTELADLAGASAGISVRLLAELGFDTVAGKHAARDRLAPGSALVRHRVVWLADGALAGDDALVTLDSRVAWYLRTGRVELGGLPDGVTWHRSEGMPLADHLSPIAEQLARTFAIRPAPLVVLFGDEGAGKTSTVIAGAASVGRPVLAVDADHLTDDRCLEIWPEVIRDAALSDAVIYVRCERRAPRWGRLLEQRPGAVALGTTCARAPWMNTEAREHRADVVPIAMPALSDRAQLQIWGGALQELGRPLMPKAELEVELCRPGLTVGDIVDSATEASARATAAGVPLDIATLARALDDRCLDRLRLRADVVLPAAGVVPGLRAEIAEWLEQCAALIQPGADAPWAMGTDASRSLNRVAVFVTGATDAERLAVVANLATRLARPLVRVSTATLVASPAALASAHFVEVLSLTARANAMLMVHWRDVPALHPLRRSLGQMVADRVALLAVGCDDAGALGELETIFSAGLSLDGGS